MAATEAVLQEIGFPGITIRENGNKDSTDVPSWEILAMIGLVGGLKGHLVLHFPPNSSVSFVTHLSGHLGMTGENPEDMQYRKAAVAEIANQIGGKASALLSDMDIDCMITPPTLLSGNGIQAVLPEADEHHSFLVSGEFGTFFCILALKNSRPI